MADNNECVIIRKATSADCAVVETMIGQGTDSKVIRGQHSTTTAAQLMADGYTDESERHFQCLIGIDRSSGNAAAFVFYCFGYCGSNGKVMNLNNIYVNTEWRRRKIGTRLIQKLVSISQDEKCNQLQFSVPLSNNVAMKFFQQMGAVNLTEDTGYLVQIVNSDVLNTLAGATHTAEPKMAAADERVSIRPASPADCEPIVTLIKELVAYQGRPGESNMTADRLRADGFTAGSPRLHRCLVVEEPSSNKIVAYAMYYFSYSTVYGKYAYLEDIYVKEQWRGADVGSHLFKHLAGITLAEKCALLKFVVLRSKPQAVQFYERLGAVNATTDEGYQVLRLRKETLKAAAQCGSETKVV